MYRNTEFLQQQIKDLRGATIARAKQLEEIENSDQARGAAQEILSLTARTLGRLSSFAEKKIFTVTGTYDGEVLEGSISFLFDDLQEALEYWEERGVLFLQGWYNNGKWIVGIYDNPKQGCLEEVEIGG
jgi:hypothetical protein